MERKVKKKRAFAVVPGEEIDAASDDPVGRVQVFGHRPRTGHDGVAIDAVLKVIGVGPAGFLPKPRHIIVVEIRISHSVASVMKIAVVQFDRFEPEMVAFGAGVEFADGMGAVAVPGEFSGQGNVIVPWNTVAVADAAVMGGGEAGHQRGAGGNAGGGGGISAGETNAPQGEFVEIGSVHHGMTIDGEAVPPPLVHVDKDDVGF